MLVAATGFWHGGKALVYAAAALTLIFVLSCLAGLSNDADAGTHGSASRAVTARALLNMNLFGQFDYATINPLAEGDGVLSPFGAGFTTGTCYWNTSILDSNGWPNNDCAASFGGGLRIPSSTAFSGQYTFDGVGTGKTSFPATGTFTMLSGVSCGGVASGTPPNTLGKGWGYTFASLNGTFTTTDTGNGFCAPFTISGAATPQFIAWYVSQTDPRSTGSFVKNLRWYRQSDYVDLTTSGRCSPRACVFRAGYLQPIVNLHPGAVRTMNWTTGVNSPLVRFENRALPTTAGLLTGSYWLNSPPYTVSSGTNAITVAAATGTPVSMKHGEVATFRIGANSNPANGAVTVSSVSNHNPGKVTTSSAHGFTTGDIVIADFGSSAGNFNLYPVCANVVDATHFTIALATNCSSGIDTTTWSFSLVGCSCVTEYVRLNVGGRGVYPLVRADGFTPLSNAFSLTTGKYVQLVFDKNSAGITDGSGNAIKGAWIYQDNQTGNYGAPLEIQTELINELNGLLQSQSPGASPIHMFASIPQMALEPQDPDYTTASDYPANAVKTIINGANGYPGLCSGCLLFVELIPDETWNFAGAFTETFYFVRQSYLRWPSTGGTDPNTFSTFRAVLASQDIVQNSGVYNSAKVKLAHMGGVNQGLPGSSGSGNYVRVFGSSTLFSDPLWPNASNPPYVYFDVSGYAPYINPTDAWNTANLATMAAKWASDAGNAPAQEADCAAWLAGLYVANTPNSLVTITDLLALNASWIATMQSIGKVFVNYEGGSNWSTGGSLTTTESNFLNAVYLSQAWANDLVAFAQTYNSASSGLPGLYIECNYYLSGGVPSVNYQWAFCSPDTYNGTTTEGMLSKAWNGLSTMDNGLPYLLNRDIYPASRDNTPAFMSGMAA
jgi:hypothetical protein